MIKKCFLALLGIPSYKGKFGAEKEIWGRLETRNDFRMRYCPKVRFHR